MKTKKTIFYMIFFLLLNQNANGQFWKKFKKAVGDVTKAATDVTMAPLKQIETSTKVLSGKGEVKDFLTPYKGIGDAIESTTGAVYDPYKSIHQEAEKFASNIGEEAEFIYDISTFNEKYLTEVANTSSIVLANTLRGNNILESIGIPLSAALKSARNRFIKKAKPLPEDVKNALRGKIPDATLDRAKYAVGDMEITLPNIINYFNTRSFEDFFSNKTGTHAVTIDDLIIFSDFPGSFNGSKCFWTHELWHVDQYRRWGIDKFVFKYLTNEKLESDADNNANRILNVSDCKIGGEGFLTIGGGSNNDVAQEELDLVGLGSNTGINNNGNNLNDEIFIAQCIFRFNNFPANYYLTNKGRLVAVSKINFQTQHYGYAVAPPVNNIAWTYHTALLNYQVMHNGVILFFKPILNHFGQHMIDRFGRPMYNQIQVGHVIRLI